MSVALLATAALVSLLLGGLAWYAYSHRSTAAVRAHAVTHWLRLQLQDMAARRARRGAISIGQAYVFAVLQLVGSLLACALTWWLSESLLALLVVATLSAWLPGFLARRKAQRRFKQIEQALPGCLLMLASSIKSGASLPTAIQIMVGEQKGFLADEFALLIRDQKLGVDFDVALQRMSERIDIPDFHLVTVALRVSREVGGNLSEILISLSQTIKNKLALEGKIDALTAQGRIQGIVMALMPVPIGAALLFLENEAMSQMFTTTLGHLFIGLILVLEIIGYKMIQKILRIDI